MYFWKYSYETGCEETTFRGLFMNREVVRGEKT